MKLKSIITYLITLNFFFFTFIELKKFVSFNFVTCYSKKFTQVILIFSFLKKLSLFKFTTLADICVVDYPSRLCRYEIIYNLLSTFFNVRLFIKFFLKESDFMVTLTTLYFSSG
jgi:NADH:ubiquinone oxidoreductase subunit C